MRLFWVFHLVGDVAFFLAGACCGAALTTGELIRFSGYGIACMVLSLLGSDMASHQLDLLEADAEAAKEFNQ